MIFDKLVEIYKKRILTSKDRKNETQKIIQEIDTLICTKSKQKITNEHKIYILNKLKNELENKLPILHFHLELSAQDNKDYLELINLAIKTLGGK